MAAKKPKGWGKFHGLMKRIVATPKAKVDRAIARERRANKRSPQKD